MVLSPALLLLAGAAFCAHLGDIAEIHTLHYGLTVTTLGGSVHPSFFAEGFWDHQLFLQYDSNKKEDPKPQGPWMERPLGTETWDREIEDLTKRSKNLKVILAEINVLRGQKGGSHSLQETWGCEIQEDNRTRGFWIFYYDGALFLSYHPETCSWKVHPSCAQTLAMKVKESWEADDIQSKTYWAQVHGEICGRVRKYAVSWKGSSHIPAPGILLSPVVDVTCSETLESTVNVTCCAFGFYPRDISLFWLQDGEPLSQDTQQSGGVFPYGNGTYQSCVSTRIPLGQVQSFQCHIGHSNKNSTGRVPCGTTLLLWNQWPLAMGLAARAIAMIMSIFCVRSCKKRKTTSAVECPELVSLQVLDQQQKTPSDHSGPT